ncbi:disease resistance-like protein [Cinnamomum micranthum f. kanehirae]|uniref:Disease resistance-like protein n=1 Tax=Cinnamomum micranthum f. kanehirae TaxID=337451 RepID=A0A3S3NEG9_9MAGN|nr:disease resistance-like protein [Cinnamomum micranthum f. kanehirae]
MDVFGAIISLLSCLCKEIGRKHDDLKTFNKDMETLKKEMKYLSGKEDDIKIKLQRGDQQVGMKCKSEVKVVREQIENLKNEVDSLEHKEKLGCLKCEVCFCYSKLMLSGHVKEKIKEAIVIQEKMKSFGELFIDGVVDTGKTLPMAKLVYTATTQRTLEIIWDSLLDTNFQKIGVYGMGGVGKTIMMKHTNNRLKEDSIFDHVIWVTVSKDTRLERLQSDIAKEIGIPLEEHDDRQHTSVKIYAALHRRKFVLILDDIWKAFPLEEIGIPEPSEDNNCKVILSTRDLKVCRQMEIQKLIKVEVLPEKEAWDLFKVKVGGNMVITSKLEKVAKLVVKECGGLPLAIITVGRALRQVDDVRVWRNALNELKFSTAGIEGMEAGVFASLRFSYMHLRNDELRACFLYCVLYPEDHEIPTMELVKYWIYEGLISEERDSEAENDKGYAILNEIKNACLLERIDNRSGAECVKMHDLIRDMAIIITRVSPLFIVKLGVDLEELPQMEESMENVERISLTNNNIQVLAGEPKCPKLSTLWLQHNRYLKNISPSFFEHMKSLRVLNLSYTRIKCLPESLSNLENLRALLLHYCYDLKTMSPVTNLKLLRFLDLYYSGIEVLPQGMERLVNLRRLNLSRTFSLNILPIGVMRNLSLLEELYMYRSRYRWSSNSLQVEGGASIEEIINSTHLTNLHVHLVDLPSFDAYVKSEQWQKLESFYLIVGQVTDLLPPDTSKMKYIVEIGGCHIVDCERPLVLPSNTQYFAIENCNDIVGLSELPWLSHLNELKECHISRCNALRYITVAENNTTLTTLETLDLWELPELTSICKGVVQHDTLKCLKRVKVDGCHSLKNLFSVDWLHHLKNIEEIQIRNCMMMEEIIFKTEECVALSRLTSLELECLPNLRSIFWGVCMCDSLQTINVTNCPKLKELPSSIATSSLTLKAIKGSRKWWNALKWSDPGDQINLEHFFKEQEEEDDDDDDEAIDDDDDEIRSL